MSITRSVSLVVNTSTAWLAPAGTTNWGPNQCTNDPDGTVALDERVELCLPAGGAAHGNEAVRAKNVVHQQGEERQTQDLPRVSPQVLAGLAWRNIANRFQSHHAFASRAESITQACVSLAIFDDSWSVAASV